MSVPYTVYDKATGEILHTGQCQTRCFYQQARGNAKHKVALFTANKIEDKIVEINGVPVRQQRPEKEIEDRKAFLVSKIAKPEST